MNLAPNKAIGFFLTTIVLAILVFVVHIVINKAVLTFTGDLSDYSVYINNDETHCPIKTCVLKVKPGKKDVLISKNKYFNLSINLSLVKGDRLDIPFSLQKLPSLEIVKDSPEKVKQPSIPKLLKDNQNTIYDFRNNMFLFFLQNKMNYKYELKSYDIESKAIKTLNIFHKELIAPFLVLPEDDTKLVYLLSKKEKDYELSAINMETKRKRHLHVFEDNKLLFPAKTTDGAWVNIKNTHSYKDILNMDIYVSNEENIKQNTNFTGEIIKIVPGSKGNVFLLAKNEVKQLEDNEEDDVFKSTIDLWESNKSSLKDNTEEESGLINTEEEKEDYYFHVYRYNALEDRLYFVFDEAELNLNTETIKNIQFDLVKNSLFFEYKGQEYELNV